MTKQKPNHVIMWTQNNGIAEGRCVYCGISGRAEMLNSFCNGQIVKPEMPKKPDKIIKKLTIEP